MARTAPAIDAPEGYEYTPAPADVQAVMRARFDDNGLTAIDPNRPGVLLHNVGNWWDGAHEVTDNGDGTFSYTNPYNGYVDTFGTLTAPPVAPMVHVDAETAVAIGHQHYNEYADTHTHGSVTELELCDELNAVEAEREYAAETWAEGAWLRHAESYGDDGR